MSRRTDRTSRAQDQRPLWRRLARHPLAHLVAALVLVAIIQGLFVKVYQVPSESMQQTLLTGDRLLVNRLAYAEHEPTPGDIIVFERPATWGETRPERGTFRTIVGWFGDIFGFGPSNSDALVKRVVAVGGETISCCDAQGQLLKDGQPLPEPFLASDLPFIPGELDCATAGRSRRCFPAVTVPAGNYLVLGDNRANSSDGISNCRGSEASAAPDCARFVSHEAIVGEVFFVALPINRWGAPLR